MIQSQNCFYTKFLKTELEYEAPTINFTGLASKLYFADSNHPKLIDNSNELEIFVKVDIEGFTNPNFVVVQDGVLQSNSLIMKSYVTPM
jgi:hypothetical protein